MSSSLFHPLRRQVIVILALVWLAVLLIVYFSPLCTEGQRAVFAEFYADQPLRLLLLLALILGLRQITNQNERRFWQYLTVAFVLWFIGDIAFQPPPGAEPTVILGLVEDIVFLAFYPMFFIALEQQPLIRTRTAGLFENRLLLTGILLICTATFCYFVIVIAFLDPDTYLTVVPSYTYFVVLDLVITIRLFSLCFTCNVRRWFILYGLLGLAMANWTAGDLLDALHLTGNVELPLGTMVDFIWLPAYYVMIGALTYRNRSAPATATEGNVRVIDPHQQRPSTLGKLLIFAGLLPLVHLVMLATDWLGQDTVIIRGLLALLSALLLGALALAHFRRDRSERSRGETAISVVLSDEEMKEARKMEALGRLAGGVAHDFNNMLTALQGYTELMVLAESDEERMELATQCRAGVTKAAELTRQLLAFSRKQMLKQEAVNLNTVIHDLDHLVGRIIGEDVALVLKPGENLWPVDGDRSQLTQVILNLVVNARQSMPDGGRLCLRTANVNVRFRTDLPDPHAPKGDHVRLEVQDTGCGIEEELQSRVFEPFFRGRPDGTGSGLGLAMVYGVVKQSGGRIELASSPGKGSTFSLFFPRSTRPVPVETKAAAPAPPQVGGHETILLVEDEASLRNTLARYLSSKGYHVLEACNGREALDLVRSKGPSIDLLLTDVVMPEMNGEMLADRLHRELAGLRVLFISGYIDEPANLDLARPDWEFLGKPFSFQELAARVRALLDSPI